MRTALRYCASVIKLTHFVDVNRCGAKINSFVSANSEELVSWVVAIVHVHR